MGNPAMYALIEEPLRFLAAWQNLEAEVAFLFQEPHKTKKQVR